MFSTIYLKWEELDFKWEEMNFSWEEVAIVEEVGRLIRGGGGGYSEYVKGNPWEKTKQALGDEKTKKFIRIFCRVNGLDYEKVSEPNSGIRVTVEQVEKVFNEAAKIGVKINI